MPRRSPRTDQASRPPLRRVFVVLLALALLGVAVVTGALNQVVLHAVAWPSLTGGWIAEQVGAAPGTAAHTLGRLVGQVPWTVGLLVAALSIVRQWIGERSVLAAERAFDEAHGDELTELRARVEEAPGLIDGIEAEAARAGATAEILGADAWAAGAVVARLPVRLVVERPGNRFSLHDVEDGELAVRAHDLRFTGTSGETREADVQVWEHAMTRPHREPTRLLLGHTGTVRPDGVPVGVQAIVPVLDHLEVLLDLAAGTANTYTARQRLVRLAGQGATEVDRILDRGELDLVRIDELEALRPTPDASVPANPTIAATVWGRGAEKASRTCLPVVLALLKPREVVEYVVRVRGGRGAVDVVVATDRRILGLVTTTVATDGFVLSVPRDGVLEVTLAERTRAVSLGLSDGREVALGRLTHVADEVPTLFHLSPAAARNFTSPDAGAAHDAAPRPLDPDAEVSS